MKSNGRKSGWLVALLGCVVLGGVSVLPAQLEAAGQGIGVITQLSGEAWLISEPGALIPLSEGAELPLGVDLRCGGSLTIRFDDGSLLRLAADTVIRILETGEVVVKRGSAEFTTTGGQLVRLKADDRIKVKLAKLFEPEPKRVPAVPVAAPPEDIASPAS